MAIEDCGVGSMKEECQIWQYEGATVGSIRSRTGLEQRGMNEGSVNEVMKWYG